MSITGDIKLLCYFPDKSKNVSFVYTSAQAPRELRTEDHWNATRRNMRLAIESAYIAGNTNFLCTLSTEFDVEFLLQLVVIKRKNPDLTINICFESDHQMEFANRVKYLKDPKIREFVDSNIVVFNEGLKVRKNKSLQECMIAISDRAIGYVRPRHYEQSVFRKFCEKYGVEFHNVFGIVQKDSQISFRDSNCSDPAILAHLIMRNIIIDLKKDDSFRDALMNSEAAYLRVEKAFSDQNSELINELEKNERIVLRVAEKFLLNYGTAALCKGLHDFEKVCCNIEQSEKDDIVMEVH